jgi:hypothetical protein
MVMAKRFKDTNLWKHDWFQKLLPHQKLLWNYICDECDGNGVWLVNYSLASFLIGTPVTGQDLESLGDKFVWLSSDKIWIHGFIKFQYGGLKATSPAHRGIMRSLISLTKNLPLTGGSLDLIEEFKISLDRESETLGDPLRGSETLQYKYKYKSYVLERGSGGKQSPPAEPEKSEIQTKPVENPIPDLEELYQKYPRKEGKSAGLRKLKAQIKTQKDFDDLSRAIDRYNKHCEQNQTERQFIKHFSTFATSWRDFLEEGFGEVILPGCKAVTPEEIKKRSERADEEYQKRKEAISAIPREQNKHATNS